MIECSRGEDEAREIILNNKLVVRSLKAISTSFAICKLHAIFCLKFACERSQCNFDLFARFDFLRTFACERKSCINASKSETII